MRPETQPPSAEHRDEGMQADGEGKQADTMARRSLEWAGVAPRPCSPSNEDGAFTM